MYLFRSCINPQSVFQLRARVVSWPYLQELFTINFKKQIFYAIELVNAGLYVYLNVLT